jgi:two-component system invasion response regulator UvrY
MIRVLIADDHALVRRGLKDLLDGEPDMELAGEAATAQDLVALARRVEWSVAVLDVSLPDAQGLELLKQVKAAYPERPVIVLSMHPEEQYAVRAIRSGAATYLTKESAATELLQAIRKVAQGGRYVTPSLAERLAEDVTRAGGLPHEQLSDREFEVLRLIASGKSVGEIAAALSLSVKTVSTYRTRVLQKMNLRHNAELTRYAIAHGLA